MRCGWLVIPTLMVAMEAGGLGQEFRQWTTRGGQKTWVNLAAIEVVGNSVRFRRQDDQREFTFPLNRLSDQDQQELRETFNIQSAPAADPIAPRTLAPVGPRGNAGVQWPEPELSDDNLDQWADFIWPQQRDLVWRNIRWHNNLGEAAYEARRLNRPILLWTMNGNPCGET